jgi:TolA-binding protein
MRLTMPWPLFGIAFGSLAIAGCTTKAELKRQQELERIKQDVTVAKTAHVDTESQLEDVRTDLQKLALSVEQQHDATTSQVNELRRELAGIVTRLHSLEQKLLEEEMARKGMQAELRAAREDADKADKSERVDRKADEEKKRATFDQAKKLFDEGKFESAVLALREVIAGKKASSPEGKTARFLLGEALFQGKEYAAAALAFDDFKKQYPNDPAIPQAMYRQANAFRLLGKKEEARLFYQDVIDKFPKSSQAGRAKNELKKLK